MMCVLLLDAVSTIASGLNFLFILKTSSLSGYASFIFTHKVFKFVLHLARRFAASCLSLKFCTKYFLLSTSETTNDTSLFLFSKNI